MADAPPTCTSLGSRVGIGGLQAGCLSAAIFSAHAGLAVHLISADGDEAPDAAIHACGLQQHVCAVCVVDGEGQAVAKGVVHVGLQVKIEFSTAHKQNESKYCSIKSAQC